MKKKVLSLLLMTSLVASTLAGCGSSSSADTSTQAADTTATTTAAADTAAPAATDDSTPVTLRFSWWGGDERNAATSEVIKQFQELHPNVTIEAEFGGSDGYHDKLATQLASGTSADIVQVDPETFPTYIDTGDYFVNLADYDIDMSDFDADYIAQEVNGCYDGKQLGLPTGIAGPSILVNKDLADAVGIDMQKADMTWNDWIEMGKKVQEYDSSMYLLCANKEYITNLVVLTYAKQLIGGNIFNKETGKLQLTEEQLTEIFTFVKALYDNGVVAPASYQASYTGDDIQSDANWLAGKYVATFAYISTIDVMVAGYPDANYVPGSLPMAVGAKDGGWGSNTPQVLAITKTCKNPDVAAAFLDYFYNDQKAQETLKATRSVPPTASARALCAENGSLTQIVSDSSDVAIAIKGSTNDKITSSQEAKAIVCDAVESIGYGQMTPEEAASEMMDSFAALEK